MTFSKEDIRLAIARVSSRLDYHVDPALQAEFEAGLYPHLLANQKIQTAEKQLPIIAKYLIGAATFVNQPVTYYDIFRACRCVYIVNLLDHALEIHATKNTPNVADRIQRLRVEEDHDRFDSIFFEVLTGARYASSELVDHVAFVRETPTTKTPDLLVVQDGLETYFECKKTDRTQSHSAVTRDIVRTKLTPVLAAFRGRRLSIVADLTFHVDPAEIGDAAIYSACDAALKAGTIIISRDFTVRARRLSPYQSDDYALYPSPKFYWERYGFRVRSEWLGIVHHLEGSFAQTADLPAHLEQGHSTWLETSDWDGAIKWRIDIEEVVAKYRRFAFNNVFKGLAQIREKSINSGVHLWLESDYAIQGRRDPLLDLFNRLKTAERDVFGWIIINETLFDISPQGYFDLIEHAHVIQGPTALTKHPPLSNVFTVPDPDGASGAFGVGGVLPDIDASS